MKKFLVFILCFIMTALLFSLSSCDNDDTPDTSEEVSAKAKDAEILTYDYSGSLVSDRYVVTVSSGENEKNVVCYKATSAIKTLSSEDEGKIETEEMAFCLFDSDFSSPVTVKITPRDGFENCVVRPLAEGIKAEKEDSGVTFEIKEPCKLSVEFDDGIFTNLFIYAGNITDYGIDETDENVVYYGPGEHDAQEL